MTQPLSRSVSDRVEKTQNPQLPGTETSLKLIKQTERQRCPLGHTAETRSGSALTREQTCHQECVSCLPSPVLLPHQLHSQAGCPHRMENPPARGREIAPLTVLVSIPQMGGYTSIIPMPTMS